MAKQAKAARGKKANPRNFDSETIILPRIAERRNLGIEKVVVKIATITTPLPTQFRDVGSNGLIELVGDPSNKDTTRLLLWRDGKFTIRSSVQVDGVKPVPESLDSNLLNAVRLPHSVARAGPASEVLMEISNCIAKYLDIDSSQCEVISLFVLYTWFQDVLPTAPYLAIFGPYGAGKSTLLSLLRSVCRRAIRVSDFSASALYLLPSFRPTLLIDEFDSRIASADQRNIMRLLRSGNDSEGQVFRRGKFHSTFCAKVIASRVGSEDAALQSRTISVTLRPTRRSMPPLDHSILEAIAAQLQPILLGYRLQNYGQVLMHFHSDVPDFTPRTKAIARALGAPLLGDETLKRRLYANLLLRDKDAILNRQAEPEYAVAAALYRRSHFGDSYFTVGELADLVSVVLSELGVTFTLHPRAVGARLSALGLHSEKLGSQGYGFRMTLGFKRQAHEIARDLGIVRSDILGWLAVEGGYGGYKCSLCDELGLNVRSNDGEPLRSVAPPGKPRRSNLYER